MADTPSSLTNLSGLSTDRTEDGGVVIRGSGYTLTPEEDGALRIDGIGPCGQAFPNVGRVLEPTSVDPALELACPLGITGVADILRGILAWKLTMEMAEESAKGGLQ